jgi:hypothetical protein
MQMRSRLAEHIVEVLRYGADRGSVSLLERHTAQQWKQVLPWLDASGLALYFLDRIETLGASAALPPATLARLRQNLADNRERTAALLAEMRAIHREFDAAGVEFAVLKGYSLVPDYCPAAALRHQCDLDYLVAPPHLHRALGVLCDLDYSRVRTSSGTYTFARSTGEMPSRNHIYTPGVNYSIELHAALWENQEVATLEPLTGVLARRRLHWACGLTFPALAPEDRFIHQCIHLLSHTLQFWIRLAWLYELAGFLAGARADAAFWQSVEERIAGAACIAKAVRLATLLAICIFGGQAPRLQIGGHPSLALWVREYGGEWAMYGLPGSKLSLFLFREFTDEQRWRQLERRRLFPVHRPPAATQLSFWRPRRSLRSRLAELRYAGRRLRFHIRETWRYLRERPHWQRRLLTLQQAVPPAHVETVLQ